ncbi:DNA-directed RNA polymerases i, ii, and iii 17.1 kda polypeptide [Cutaneotrichosporon oleaginosum]|uniref:DNA-directed RNA polymerases I, II, and III subunit RPABC3 n=1 Tax=Cutaneotrichosporon oleaginosum TaxID=879819 RepID=A0A0J0XY25_9TREE|nr:DNA-directed RNA polymerases i, ii, and iii 17.1 kda polypeptide [Cutaneotrichosporon oleaginosum]KLT45940.1 DNA-directed RNA polymerases i, ii, and iii 17.1 kda polypeptide [Cutaneotrichosporon oleaginosum]TXT06636.1 hypothetical protein COLE_05967 [Cutaneotrichosporon oleaginosum]
MNDDRPNVIFEDRFEVKAVDEDGKKFDRVSRIKAESRDMGMSLHLDIANELYPLQTGEVFSLLLARSLKPEDDVPEEEDGDAPRKIKRELWRADDQGLANDYDYVLFGKVYKFDDSVRGDNQTTAYASFGGLLMALRGSFRHLAGVTVGENVYLLMRK